ncbi:MAG: TetR/AcrR family transcriptional regulator [Jannaschia sp.]
MSKPNQHPDIIDDVARVFRANGFHGTTMSVLSERTGLGRSSIYHHFGRGKLEMAQRSLDVVEAFIATMDATTRDLTIPARARWDRIEKMLRQYYEDGQLGCLLAVFSLEDVPDELRDRTKALFDRWLMAMSALCDRDACEDAEADDFALGAVMMIQGGLVLSRAQSSRAAFERGLSEVSLAVMSLPRSYSP